MGLRPVRRRAGAWRGSPARRAHSKLRAWEISIVNARAISVVAFVFLEAVAAEATPYWVAYEGDDFPESAGWTRYWYEPMPSSRSVSEGVLTLDSSASQWTYDFYRIQRMLNPGPGEVFLASWRL